MACGQTKQQLVQITPLVRKPTPKQKPPKQQQFFHCAVCGFTTFRAKKMAAHHDRQCPGPKPIPYQIERASVCEGCEHRRGLVCLPIKIANQHLGKPGLVSVGVSMAGCRCPEGKWHRAVWNCPHCGHIEYDQNGKLTKCVKCGRN